MNITLVTVGTRGDVQPMLALGVRLRQRGHAVTLAAPPDFRAWVGEHGLDFAPVGTDIRQYLRDNPRALSARPADALRTATEFFGAQLPLQVRDIDAACEQADIVAWTGLALGAVLVAEKRRLPLLGICLSDCALPSSGQHPPPSSRRHGLPRWLNRLLWSVHGTVVDRAAGRPMNALRAEAGLPPARLSEFFSRGEFIVAADPVLFPPDRAWGTNIRRAGFIFHDNPRPLDPALEAWLNEGEPPVYIGFGSMSGAGIERIEDIVRAALSATGRRCLIGAGWADLGRGGLPAHWRVVGDAPHQALFPRMAAVVHHGGSGTMANALRAGVPQVVLPLILDQYHHAHRLWKAGLMPKTVAIESVTAPQLTAAIRDALALPAAPRDAVARRLRESDGASEVALALEALAAGRPQPSESPNLKATHA